MITFITPYNAVCGVAEMAKFLITEIRKTEPVSIISNLFEGAYTRTNNDAPEDLISRLFSTGFQEPEKRLFDFIGFTDHIKKHGSRVLVLNYQDFLFPFKEDLNNLAIWCAPRKIRCYVIIHDTAIDPKLNLAFWHPIVPPSLAGHGMFCLENNAMEGTDYTVIDQGIPDFSKVTANQLRSSPIIGCFGLGRNKTLEIMDALPEGVSLLVCTSNQGLMLQLMDHPKANTSLILEIGYKPAEELACILKECDAIAIWYPELDGIANSSAFRFALGCQVPIFCNPSNWISDFAESEAFISVRPHPKIWKKTLEEYFGMSKADRSFYQSRLQIFQQDELNKRSWSLIAGQYLTLWT